MTDEEITEMLRANARNLSAIQLVDLLEQLTGEVSHPSYISYFKRAFPNVPLRLLLELGEWHRYVEGGISDEEFEQRLAPWLSEDGNG